ncbi:hypothetical protein DTO96_100323 [Ephemeroptericola cinctiostellae]|uniref:Uncharacterized protein n=1 Tax=Ephemeroptericola cinctiostellae TaxID=2268024 RepID=A0A345D8C6_9BURK|nr:hypothetical protein DTO96_100323 [Ephemeroptericola cinctiostellae]
MLNVGAVVHKASCPLIRLALHPFFMAWSLAVADRTVQRQSKQ